MREIKFRAWDKVKEKMQDIKPLDFAWLGETAFSSKGKVRYAVMQYTGLKDKNGKEIFEGDVLIAWYGRQQGYRSLPNAVQWDDGKVGFIPFVNSRRKPEDYEVIGNIYEHPHLLKHEA